MSTPAYHETWREWKPPEAPEPNVLLDRDELLARLQDLRIEASERDLKFWQAHGLIPRGTKARVGRSTKAYYPRAVMALIILLRDLQELEIPLRDAKPHLRAHAAKAFEIANETEGSNTRRSTKGDVTLRNWTRRAAKTALLDLLNSDLARLSRRYEEITGKQAGLVRTIFYELRDGLADKILDQHDFTVHWK